MRKSATVLAVLALVALPVQASFADVPQPPGAGVGAPPDAYPPNAILSGSGWFVAGDGPAGWTKKDSGYFDKIDVYSDGDGYLHVEEDYKRWDKPAPHTCVTRFRNDDREGTLLVLSRAKTASEYWFPVSGGLVHDNTPSAESILYLLKLQPAPPESPTGPEGPGGPVVGSPEYGCPYVTPHTEQYDYQGGGGTHNGYVINGEDVSANVHYLITKTDSTGRKVTSYEQHFSGDNFFYMTPTDVNESGYGGGHVATAGPADGW